MFEWSRVLVVICEHKGAVEHYLNSWQRGDEELASFSFFPPLPPLSRSLCSWQGGIAVAGTAVTSWHHTHRLYSVSSRHRCTNQSFFVSHVLTSEKPRVKYGDTIPKSVVDHRTTATHGIYNQLSSWCFWEMQPRTLRVENVLSFSHCAVSSFPTGIALPAVLLWSRALWFTNFWFYGLVLHWFFEQDWIRNARLVCLSLFQVN